MRGRPISHVPDLQEAFGTESISDVNSGPAYGEKIGTYKDEPLYHASLDGSEYRALLSENGFDVISHVVEDPTCGYRTIWLARRRA